MKTKRENGYYYSKDGKLTEVPVIPFEALGSGLWLVQIEPGLKSRENLLKHKVGDIKDVQLYASLLVKYRERLSKLLIECLDKPNTISNIAETVLIELTKLIEKDEQK